MRVRGPPPRRTLPSRAASFSTSLPRCYPDAADWLPSYGPVGVARALLYASDPPSTGTTAATPCPTIFTHEFSLADRVALVTGANRGIGLEMALALVEAGARAVYCVDLPETPGEHWVKVSRFVEEVLKGRTGGEGKFEYVCGDVRDQEGMWKIAKTIGDREGRMDACVAAAAVIPQTPGTYCLTCSAESAKEVLDVNVNGMLYTAQAAGRQMERFGKGGSIIMVASISGTVTIRGAQILPYDASKAAVLQMARSMACELGPKGIRVNTVSPGVFKTAHPDQHLDISGAEEPFAGRQPLLRIGRPDELRGVAVWLASDASSFCTGSDFFVSGGYQVW